jgi:hypothetical protein
MNKNLIYAIIGGALLLSGVVYLFIQSNGAKDADMRSGEGEVIVVSTSCESACAQAEASCPMLLDEVNCVSACEGMSTEAQLYLQSVYTCEALTARLDLVSSVVVPDVASTTGRREEAQGDGCEASCDNYVAECLSLVPNATEDLLREGYDSCMSECAEWDTEKVSCIAEASDCPSMTEVCGL